jgi:hypothetical protein
VNAANGIDLAQQGTDLRGIIDIVRRQCGGNDLAVSASMPMCSLRQDRRVLVPCFSSGQKLHHASPSKLLVR